MIHFQWICVKTYLCHEFSCHSFQLGNVYNVLTQYGNFGQVAESIKGHCGNSDLKHTEHSQLNYRLMDILKNFWIYYGILLESAQFLIDTVIIGWNLNKFKRR